MAPYRDSGTENLWPGLVESVPREFAECLREPAFSMDDTTFCIWRRYADKTWQCGTIEFPDGNDPDGSAYLLTCLDGNPESYRAWAEDYYTRPVLLSAVRQVYEHRPLTEEL